MTVSINTQTANADHHIMIKLEQLCDYAHCTISSIECGKSCEDIFEQFSKVKKAMTKVESLLLTNQLQCCLLRDIPYINELFITLQSLSNKGYGALIVIERDNNIEKVINKDNLGVLIDAKLTGQLLETIFFPGTPLHDGAVIIREERIFSAGCVLPLSKQLVTRKKIGTRHRAALGLSEICDAIVIVVSEETRRISIAFKGEILLIEKVSDLSGYIKH